MSRFDRRVDLTHLRVDLTKAKGRFDTIKSRFDRRVALTHNKSRFDRRVVLTQLRVDLTEGSFRQKGRFHSRVDLTYARVIPRWRAKTKLIGANVLIKSAPFMWSQNQPVRESRFGLWGHIGN